MGLAGYKMEDSDIFMDVKSSFHDCIEEGMTPGKATKAVCKSYKEALMDEDDAVFVWAALVDAQRDAGKLLSSTKTNCLVALERELARLDTGDIVPGDHSAYQSMITDFRAKLEFGNSLPKKRRLPVKCDWEPGDVYAVQLLGDRAKSCGIEGRYLLLRMIRPFAMGRDIYPYVYLSVSAESTLPTSAEDISRAKYLCVSAKREYQIVIVSRTQEEFLNAGFQYIGNYPYVAPPLGQHILPENQLQLYRITTLTKHLTERACRLYEHFVLGLELDTTPFS